MTERDAIYHVAEILSQLTWGNPETIATLRSIVKEFEPAEVVLARLDAEDHA